MTKLIKSDIFENVLINQHLFMFKQCNHEDCLRDGIREDCWSYNEYYKRTVFLSYLMQLTDDQINYLIGFTGASSIFEMAETVHISKIDELIQQCKDVLSHKVTN